MAGRFHTEARFIDSRVVPWLLPPSPKNATLTPPLPLSLAASAVPQISGGPPPAIPFAPSLPLGRSAGGLGPPLPWQLPGWRPGILRLLPPPAPPRAGPGPGPPVGPAEGSR